MNCGALGWTVSPISDFEAFSKLLALFGLRPQSLHNLESLASRSFLGFAWSPSLRSKRQEQSLYENNLYVCNSKPVYKTVVDSTAKLRFNSTASIER